MTIPCLGLAVFALCSVPAHAALRFGATDKVTRSLPNLPEIDAATLGRFSLDPRNASLGYKTRDQKWSAKMNEFSQVNPSLSMDYGQLLTAKLGAGGTITYQNDYSEVLFNGVLAPNRKLRLQFTGSQLRSAGPDAPGAIGQSNMVLQNNYLFNIKKYWGDDRFISDMGMTAYTVEAQGMGSGDYPGLDMSEIDPGGSYDLGERAVGKLEGYLLTLSLRPTIQSRIELQHDRTFLTYLFDRGARSEEHGFANRIRYSQYFDNCVRVQGGYSAEQNADRIDIGVGRKSWNLSLSRSLDGDDDTTSIQIGYAITFNGKPLNRDCGIARQTAKAFEPLVDATVKRPMQFPRSPLVKIDTPPRHDSDMSQ